MAAFAGCIEPFEDLKARTQRSIDSISTFAATVKDLGSLFKKLGSEATDMVGKFRKKNMSGFEGTMMAAMDGVMTQIEGGLGGSFAKLAGDLIKMAGEIESGFKDPEKIRKAIFSEQAAARKEVDSAIANAKKAKEAYHKAAKDAVALKAKGSAKVAAAEDKAKEADTKYRNLLIEANQRQQRYYNTEHKLFLDRIQIWEENRIAYMRAQIVAVGNVINAAGLPAHYTNLGHCFTRCSSTVDTVQDMAVYAQGVPRPAITLNPIYYEIAPENGPTVGPPPDVSSYAPSAELAAPAVSQVAVAKPAPVVDKKAKKKTEKYKALYDYQPQNQNELGFKAGDILKVISKDPSGWWYASLGKKEGFVGSAYLEPA